MSERRLAGKVGLFVLLGLVLMVVLLLNFSQGTSVFTSTYQIRMQVPSASGLKEKAAVQLSGVQIGTVQTIGLAPDTRTVIVTLRILRKYTVRQDARFVVEQIGLLGDQFIAIYPGQAGGAALTDGAMVAGQAPFNLQEVGRSATDLIKHFDEATAVVSEAVKRLNAQVLDRQTLSNFSATVANARLATEHAASLIERLDRLVETNGPPMTVAVSNFVSFSERLETVATHLDEAIVTNRVGVRGAITNFQEISVALRNLVADLEAGRGVAGGLLKDEHLRTELNVAVTNLVLVTSNFAVLGSNLNEHGLLYKPRKPRTYPPAVYPGRSPFR